MLDGTIPAEIAEEPEAIRQTLSTSRPAASRVADRVRAAQTRRLFLIGNGTSYHTCLAGASYYGKRAHPDDLVVVPMTAGEFITYAPELGMRDALVGVSASGEFHDVVGAIQRVRDRVLTIGIVHVPNSTLAHAAEELIVSDGGPSSVPVMTKTFASTLVATQLLMAELLGQSEADSFVESAGEAATHTAAAIESSLLVVESVAERLVDYEHIFVVGAGLGSVAAMEAALKLKEIALVHAEAAEVWEMASGAATIIGPGTAVVALGLEGPGKAAVSKVAHHVVEWGAHLVEVAANRSIKNSDLLQVPAAASELHSSLVAVAPVALLAFALGRRRGATPDQPEWVARYHSQGLHHILGPEV